MIPALLLALFGCSAPSAHEPVIVDAGPAFGAADGGAADDAARSAPVVPDCDAIRSCLRRELPARYEPDIDSTFSTSALRCLGESRTAAYAARSCLPLTFGHDAVSGRALQISITCSDVCPDQTHILLTYEDPLAPNECLCVGGMPHRDFSGSYLGCAPTARPTGTAVRIRELPQADGTQRFQVLGGALGIPHGALVKAIDGRPVRQRAALERMLAQLPNRLPGSVTVGHAGYGPDPKKNEWSVYFVPRSVIEALVKLRDQLGFRQPAQTEACPSLFDSVIRFGELRVGYADACRDPTTLKLRELAAAIRRSARVARAHDVPVPPSREHCRGIDLMPTHISARDESGRVDLVYADWLAR